MKQNSYKPKKRLIPDIISPNKITIARLCLIPLFVVFFCQSAEGWKIAAACVFAVAAFTDFLDGYIARKYNVVTTVGKFLDPIADKVLVSTALIVIVSNTRFMNSYDWLSVCTGIFVAVILARELIVSGFREIAAEKKVVLAAGLLGKIKTVVQDITIIILLIAMDLRYYINIEAGKVMIIVGFCFLCVATALTLASGIEYLVANRKVLGDSKKK